MDKINRFTFFPAGKNFGIEYNGLMMCAFLSGYINYTFSLYYLNGYDIRIIGVDEI